MLVESNFLNSLYLKYCQLFAAVGLVSILILSTSDAHGQIQEHDITVDFVNVWIKDNVVSGFGDAEMEFFGMVGGPVTNGCIIDQFNDCLLPFRSVYLTPGSGLDDADDNDIYQFTIPEKAMRLKVRDDGSFVIGSVAWNRPSRDDTAFGPYIGENALLCDSGNNFCRRNGWAYWDIPSETGHYNLRFLVYGWDSLLAFPAPR